MTKLMSVCFLAILILTTACKKDLLRDLDETDPSLQSQRKRSCNTEEHQLSLLNNSEYRLNLEKRISKTDLILRTRSAGDCNSPIILPIAIHFQDASNVDISCLRTLAQRQVDILNADYSGMNEDINKWDAVAANYPDVDFSNSCIQFCLATQNHPSGYGLVNGDIAVTNSTEIGDFDPQWNGYINVFVQADLGFLGYSPLGGIGNGDGVVVDATAFGAGSGCGSISPEAPYNLGRTLTHEVGHYLLLDHLWGEGGCSASDAVDDTPEQAEPNYGCPSAGAEQCGSVDMHMSYMDYTDDACMYMFSQGQGMRMNSYVKANLQGVISKANAVCSETPGDDTATCETPTGVAASSSTQSSISLGWAGAATSYEVAIREGGTQGWIQKTTSLTNYTFQALDAATIYSIRVRAVCESEKSAWVTISAATMAEPMEDDDGCPGYGFTLNITLDDYPEETEWTIKDRENGEILFSGGPFEREQAGTTVSTNFCLESACYVVEVTDAYGDGVCCEYGDGNFEIIAEDEELVFGSDGAFGASEQIFLCVKADGKLKTSSSRIARTANLKRKAERS